MESDPIRPLLARMFSVWEVKDNDVRSGKSQELRTIASEVGLKRFSRAVDECIRYHSIGLFPTPAEFRKYVPEPERKTDGWEHTEAEWAAKKAEQETPEFKREYAKLQSMIEAADKKSGEMFRRVK